MARRQPTANISGAKTFKSDSTIEPNPGEIIDGTNTDDTLFGTVKDDQIFGEDGDDQLVGGDGRDTIEGGFGNDSLWGESGSDNLIGNDGDDQLIGGDGGDDLEGGTGNDTLWGEFGIDRLLGGDGNDQLIGGDDKDIIEGDSGNDTLWGESGDDDLFGGNNDDQLVGGTARDTLEGGAGNDTLFGFGGGSDEIDFLSGNLGADVFAIGDFNGVYYQSGDSNDTEDLSFAIIQDFSTSEDFIQATGSADDYELVTGEFTDSNFLDDNGLDTGIYLGDDLIAVAENVTIENYDRFIFTDDFSSDDNVTNAVGNLDNDSFDDLIESIFFEDNAIPINTTFDSI